MLEQAHSATSHSQTFRYARDQWRHLEPKSLHLVSETINKLGLQFTNAEKIVIASLNTPTKLQSFIDRLKYNNDHDGSDIEETAHSPKKVLQLGTGHCFEGQVFAYTVMFLHGLNPKLMLLEASQDIHHNIVVYQDKRTNLFGSVGQSSMQTLKGRPSVFPSLHTLALSYYPFYFSDRSGKWNEITLRGYSEPIDLVENYGTSFMDTEDPLWDMYLTYVNDRTKLYDIRNPQATPHLYPMIQALKYNWIQIHDEKVEIHPEIFPDGAAEIWNAFWDSYNYTEPHPTGVALVLQTQFFQLTGTTPIDLQESTDEVEFYIGKGFPLNRIISSDST